MRLIDADKLTKAIVNTPTQYTNKDLSLSAQLNGVAFRQIEILGMIEAQSTVEWIPCSKELPRVQRWVLITYVWDDDSTRYTGYGHRISNSEFYAISGERGELTLLKNYKVIAWQPLPEPYRGDK